MSNLNQVMLIGNLCADPECTSFQNGGRVANLRIATNERWKDKDGQRQERVEYHSVAIMQDGLVGVAEQYLRKGSKVFVQGKLRTRKWQDKDGNDRFSTEIVLQGFDGKLEMLDAPQGDRGGDWNRAGDSNGGQSNRSAPPPPNFDDLDDDIPF